MLYFCTFKGLDLERWARAAQCALRANEAIAPLERAVAECAVRGDHRGAGRAALQLAQLTFERRDAVVAKAWHGRAARLLEDIPDAPEQGHLAWLGSRFAAVEGRLDEAMVLADRAIDVGRRHDEPDIEVSGLLYRGLALLASGEIGSGVALQDEAAATVLAGGISPWVGGLVYCGVIWSCRNRGDWRRAAEWTDHFTRWCQRAGMATFPGTCRLHRAEVLSIRGEQQEAESEVTEACAQLALSAPWAEGDAYRILGDLRLARGELEAADAAFRRAHELGWDPQPGLALLCLRRGQHDAALRGLERSLDDAGWANRQRRGLLLAHLVMVAAEAGAHVRAQACLDELDAHPELWATLAHGAAVARARAELATALGECPAAIRHLPRAIQLWREVGSPLNVAVTQLRLAEPLMTTGDRHAAELEIAAAEAVFDHAAASRLKARCAELRAQLHPTGC